MANPKYVYVIDRLSKTFPGGKQVFDDVRLSFLPGAKIGVVGTNGSGKSTLLKIMAGIETEFNGEAWAAEGVKLGYLAQEPQLDESKNVLENVMDGVAEKKAILDRYNELAMNYSEETAEEMGKLQDQIDAADLWDLDTQVGQAMDALLCPAPELDVAQLSGGEKRRIALCRLLLSQPDILLLDEPTNHLDAETIMWLENYLQSYKGTIVLVTHDRYFLNNLTEWILELDRGRGHPYEGNYNNWLVQKEKRMKQEGRDDMSKQKTLSRELEWMNTNASARRTKSKSRIKSYQELRDAADLQKVDPTTINIPPGKRLGGVVVEVENVFKGYDDKLLIEDLTFKLPPGGIVGVIGANGMGKSTLFKMITGDEQPDKGTFKVGETVEIGFVDQSRDSLDDNKTVWEEISDGLDIIVVGKQEIASRAYCGAFNFKGADQQKKIGQLSGGERNRVHLAKTLQMGSNLLLLDEPTNDLDVETLAALEAALETFPGCAVVISHDRFFLDRIATHMLAFEGNSHVEWFEGNFEDYEADKRRRLGLEVGDTERVKFKKFDRG